MSAIYKKAFDAVLFCIAFLSGILRENWIELCQFLRIFQPSVETVVLALFREHFIPKAAKVMPYRNTDANPSCSVFRKSV